MSFPFSLIGTIIYLVYASAVLFVVVLPLFYWLLKDKSWKWWVITPITLPILIAPIVEELWINKHFNTKCQDAGIYVKRKVEADGYLDATGSGPTNVGYLKNPQRIEIYEKSGFKFKEFTVGYRLPGNKFSRVEKQSNGKWLLTIQDKPAARYQLMRSRTIIAHQIEKFESIIFDDLKKETIGRDTEFARYPDWIEGLWIQFIGNGQIICSGPISEPEKHKRIGQINKYVLIPSQHTVE